jgi:hypothetical protein
MKGPVDERQSIRLRIWQRPKDQGVDDGEDCRVGADPESERQDRQHREAGRPGEQPQRVPDIPSQIDQRRVESPHAPFSRQTIAAARPRRFRW